MAITQEKLLQSYVVKDIQLQELFGVVEELKAKFVKLEKEYKEHREQSNSVPVVSPTTADVDRLETTHKE